MANKHHIIKECFITRFLWRRQSCGGMHSITHGHYHSTVCIQYVLELKGLVLFLAFILFHLFFVLFRFLLYLTLFLFHVLWVTVMCDSFKKAATRCQ